MPNDTGLGPRLTPFGAMFLTIAFATGVIVLSALAKGVSALLSVFFAPAVAIIGAGIPPQPPLGLAFKVLAFYGALLLVSRYVARAGEETGNVSAPSLSGFLARITGLSTPDESVSVAEVDPVERAKRDYVAGEIGEAELERRLAAALDDDAEAVGPDIEITYQLQAPDSDHIMHYEIPESDDAEARIVTKTSEETDQ